MSARLAARLGRAVPADLAAGGAGGGGGFADADLPVGFVEGAGGGTFRPVVVVDACCPDAPNVRTSFRVHYHLRRVAWVQKYPSAHWVSVLKVC